MMPPAIAASDLVRMREQLLFDGDEAPSKLTRFWVLLVLAAVIASAGIVTDSTATVIGAMIVAPLMTPILGTVLSITTSDGRNLVRSLALVVAGSAAVVAIGWAVAMMVDVDVVSATSSQVAGRVQPRVLDLIAALATGVVGAFAVVRSDVSDTLPGVAIAISLVPPLAVIGVTLEAGAGDQAAGALVLFLTNVAAILLSGLVVMALYRVRAADELVDRRRYHSHASILLVVSFVVAIAVPLAESSRRITSDALRTADVTNIAQAWAEPAGWEILAVEPGPGETVVRASGPLPAPKSGPLRAAVDRAGYENVTIRLVLTPEATIMLPGS